MLGISPAGRSPRNWVRFAHLPLRRMRRQAKLGSFCTIGCSGGLRPFSCARRQLVSFRTSHFSRLGFVSQEFSPPRHREHGAGAELSPAMNWEFSLGSRCLFAVGATHASPLRLRLAGGQRAALHWLRRTRKVPDPANRRGHRCRRPSFCYRRFSMSVCCAKIKNQAEILSGCVKRGTGSLPVGTVASASCR